MSSSGTNGPEAGAAEPKHTNGSASNGSAATGDEDEAMDSGTDQQQVATIPAQPALHLTSDEVNYLIFLYVE